jgi:transcription-repair coupling factor (superfamily II helicase)
MTEQLVKIVDSIRDSEPFLERLQAKGPVTLDHVSEGAQAFVAACVIRHHASRSCWILCPDVRRQEDLFNGLLNWEVEALFFPELELPAFEGALLDPEIVAERLEVLQKIAEGKRVVVVLTASSLEDKVPPAEALQKQSIVLRRGDRLRRESVIETLIKSGYERVSQVTARGQFAVRAAFSMSSLGSIPYRFGVSSRADIVQSGV